MIYTTLQKIDFSIVSRRVIAGIVAIGLLCHVALPLTAASTRMKRRQKPITEDKRERTIDERSTHAPQSLHERVEKVCKLLQGYEAFKQVAHLHTHESNVGKPHPGIIRGGFATLKQAHSKYYKPNETDIKSERAWAAALVMLTEHLSVMVRQMLLRELIKIEKYITYWQEQKEHSFKYFFQKHPRKWLSTELQPKEIKRHLKELRGVQRYYLERLGQLHEIMDKFKPSFNAAQQYTWVAEIATMVHALVCPIFRGCPKRVMTPTAGSQQVFFALCELMMHNLNELPNQQKRIIAQTTKNKKPDHFTRHWFKYASMFATTTVGLGYVFANSKKVPQWKKNTENGVKKFYTQHFEQPVKEIKEMFWDKGSSQQRDQFMGGNPEAELNDLISRAGPLFQEYYAWKHKTTQNPNPQASQQNIDAFKESIKSGNLAQLNRMRSELFNASVNSLPSTVGASVARARTNANNINQQLPNQTAGWGTLLQSIPSLVGEIRSLVTDVQNIYADISVLGQVDVTAQKLMIKTYEYTAQVMMVKGSFFAQDGQKQLVRNKLNFAIVAMIPLSIIGYFGFKGTKFAYRWLRPTYDSTPIKKSLSEISRVFNWYEGDVLKPSYIDQGKLLLYIHKLWLETKNRHMPESMRKHLEIDVKDLSEPRFSIRQKMRIIERMYRDYGFLSHPHQLNGGGTQ